MIFLNQILAFGAAAFSIPLVIHLLNRSRFRTIEWGAMHFLESVIRVNNKRIRIEQLILLMVRCAIPVLLALCLARPVLTGWRALPGDAPSATVVLLDNSYSMDAASGDRSHFSTAMDDACDIVSALHPGSEVSVVMTGGAPTPIFDSPIFDAAAMTRELRQIPTGFGASDVVLSFESALEQFAGMANARRDLILISDFQKSDWDTIPAATIQRLRSQLDGLPVRPIVTLLQVGATVANNVSVDSLEFSRQVLGVNQPLQVRANLRNHGAKVYSNCRVVFRVDETEQAISQITLPGNATTQVLFTHQFKNPGSYVVQVELAAEDRLPTDNHFAAAVPVLEQINVLLVDGAPATEPLESETDFLTVALTPFTFGRVKLSDLIQTQTINPAELQEDRVTAASVVILANVANLAEDQVELLTQFVRSGGGLVVFLGNKIDVEWYNQNLAGNVAGLLPMQIKALRGTLDDTSNASRIVAEHFDHPALSIFNDRANGNLATAEIRKWYECAVAAATESTPGTQATSAERSTGAMILARLETGDPLIVEKGLGDGIVVQVATACDADWSNLPMRPFYLPLMQQLVTTLVTRATPPSNVATGEPLRAIFPKEAQDEPLLLTTPRGTRHTVRPVPRGTHSFMEYAATQQPGVYTLVGPDAQPRHFAVETSRAESDLRLIQRDTLDSIAADLGAQVAGTGAEFLAMDDTRRHGREIWRYVFFGLLGLVFAELVLQQRFTRVRK